jgi:hypothetical protein
LWYDYKDNFGKFSAKKICVSFCQNMDLGHILGDFLKSSSGHPGQNVGEYVYCETYVHLCASKYVCKYVSILEKYSSVGKHTYVVLDL